MYLAGNNGIWASRIFCGMPFCHYEFTSHTELYTRRTAGLISFSFLSFSCVRFTSLDTFVEWEFGISTMHSAVHMKKVAVNRGQWSSKVPSNRNLFYLMDRTSRSSLLDEQALGTFQERGLRKLNPRCNWWFQLCSKPQFIITTTSASHGIITHWWHVIILATQSHTGNISTLWNPDLQDKLQFASCEVMTNCG